MNRSGPNWITNLSWPFHFGRDHFILVVTKSLWSSPNQLGQIKTILDRPKLFWSHGRTRHDSLTFDCWSVSLLNWSFRSFYKKLRTLEIFPLSSFSSLSGLLTKSAVPAWYCRQIYWVLAAQLDFEAYDLSKDNHMTWFLTNQNQDGEILFKFWRYLTAFPG